MGKYTIYSQTVPPLVTLSKYFNVQTSARYGKIKLQLSPDGNYDMLISGDISETSVKRTYEYKDAEEELTEQMVEAYEAFDNAFLKMHIDAEIDAESSFTVQKRVAPKDSYQKKSLPVEAPSEAEVQELLLQEVKNKTYGKPAGTINPQTYVAEHRLGIIKERRAAWDEIQQLFEDIEQEAAAQANARYQREYEQRLRNYEAIVAGDAEAVEAAFERMCEDMELPLEIDLDYRYNQQEGRIIVDIELAQAPSLMILSRKTALRASGKLSVKAKTQGEMAQDASTCVVSLVYRVAAEVFNISPHLQHCEITCYDVGKYQGWVWFSFERNKLACTPMGSLNDLVTIDRFPNVSNLKVLTSTSRLEPIALDKFHTQIEKMKQRLASS